MFFHFKDDKNIPLVEQWSHQTKKTNEHKCGQTNTIKTTKHKQIVNKLTISVKASENGGERNNSKASPEKHLEQSLKQKCNHSNEALDEYEGERVQWT